mmetsp:Transcript_11748/g.33917  ORF Transcript_11748/g.33917 Transcript_11748/m.33917 type:complete len:450 (-) Transcript_11748:94-1443(-)
MALRQLRAPVQKVDEFGVGRRVHGPVRSEPGGQVEPGYPGLGPTRAFLLGFVGLPGPDPEAVVLREERCVGVGHLGPRGNAFDGHGVGEARHRRCRLRWGGAHGAPGGASGGQEGQNELALGPEGSPEGPAHGQAQVQAHAAGRGLPSAGEGGLGADARPRPLKHALGEASVGGGRVVHGDPGKLGRRRGQGHWCGKHGLLEGRQGWKLRLGGDNGSARFFGVFLVHGVRTGGRGGGEGPPLGRRRQPRRQGKCLAAGPPELRRADCCCGLEGRERVPGPTPRTGGCCCCCHPCPVLAVLVHGGPVAGARVLAVLRVFCPFLTFGRVALDHAEAPAAAVGLGLLHGHHRVLLIFVGVLLVLRVGLDNAVGGKVLHAELPHALARVVGDERGSILVVLRFELVRVRLLLRLAGRGLGKHVVQSDLRRLVQLVPDGRLPGRVVVEVVVDAR